MPQIFPRWFDTVARAGIVGGILLIPASALGLAMLYHSDYVTGARTAYEQPVPFSHEHHVGQLGIDCRYCHESASHSAFAGLPPTETCMNCHQQIWVGADLLAPVRQSWKTGLPIHWKRVHNLPGLRLLRPQRPYVQGGRLRGMSWPARPDAPHLAGPALDHGVVSRVPSRPRPPPPPRGGGLQHDMDGPVPSPRARGLPGGASSLERLKEHFRIPDTRTLTSCSTCHR